MITDFNVHELNHTLLKLSMLTTVIGTGKDTISNDLCLAYILD